MNNINNKTYLICDIGNAYIKAIHNNNKVTFPALLTKNSHFNNKSNILKYNDKESIIGYGIYNIKTEKCDRPEILSYILAAAAKCSDSNNITVDYLVLALPLGQYKVYTEKLKSSLEAQMKHEFNFNNRDITLEYKNIIILPEAISAFYAVRDKVMNLSSDTLIIDVGGGTIDIVLIDNDGNANKPKTINLGSIKLLQHIATYLEENLTGIGVVHLEKVQQYLKSGFFYNGNAYNLDNSLVYAYEDIQYIIQQLNSYYSTELKTSNVVIIDTLGILYSTLEKEFKSNNMVHIDDSFSNAYGMEIMIKNMLGIN